MWVWVVLRSAVVKQKQAYGTQREREAKVRVGWRGSKKEKGAMVWAVPRSV